MPLDVLKDGHRRAIGRGDLWIDAGAALPPGPSPVLFKLLILAPGVVVRIRLLVDLVTAGIVHTLVDNILEGDRGRDSDWKQWFMLPFFL